MKTSNSEKFGPPLSRPADAAVDRRSDAPRTRESRSLWKRVVSAGFHLLVWIYLVLLLAFWLVMYFAGDRWWFATMLLFGPRWVCGLPLAVLVPVAAAWKRRLLWPLAAGVLVLIGPILGFCLPWARLAGSSGATIRVLTCNVDGDSLRQSALRALVLETAPDVVALQECAGDEEWLRGALPDNYHIVCAGELALASRFPLQEESRRSIVNNGLCCVLETPRGPIRMCCLHLLTPRRGLSEVLDRWTVVAPSRGGVLQQVIETRRKESLAVAEWVAGFPPPVLVAGDFNMPSDSRIYGRYWSAYGNAFSQAGMGFGDTKITPLGRTSYGLRIDHILFGPRWQAVRAWVGPDVGSDHLPMLADLAWKPSSGEN